MPETTTRGSDQWGAWRTRIEAARRRRDDLIGAWQANVDRRRGSLAETTSTTDQVSINQDWALTKAKIAQLYSQTPEVRLEPKEDQFRPAVSPFGRELNYTVDTASVGTTMEEVLADVVNASGIGGVIVYYERRTEPREVPVIDPATLPPDIQAAVMAGAYEIPTETVEHTVDTKYCVERISPCDLIVPSDFTGSQYDHARWLGRDGRLTWPQAQRELGLTDDVKERVLGADRRAGGTSNSLNTDSTKFRDTEVVNYTEVFYWNHFYDAEETSFKALKRLVFVEGLEDPVIAGEPYAAQSWDAEAGRMLGVTINPIRILTLTYISDDSLPPSDSSISRFQVGELEASRDAMVQQRKHSIPIRWFDSNRVSGGTRSLLEQGTYQGFIPTNGPGDRAIGEVARASFPQEKFEFDRIIKNDLSELWQVGTNQTGAFASGERSAREAGIIERNFQRRVGQEQDKVSRFFLGIVEVLAGHLALFGTFEVPDEIGPVRTQLANAFTYNIRVDSTVRLDAEEQIERLTRGLNLTAQSGYVNIKPVVEQIWELLGQDPAKVVVDPQPNTPEPVKISVSKAEDLASVLFLASLMRTGQAPTPQDVQAAIELQRSALLGSPVPAAPALAAETAPTMGPPAEVETPGIANPDWETAPRIERRQADGGA